MQQLKQYKVTVERFFPGQPDAPAEQFVLPVDCPNAEAAVSATMSNLVAFTTKTGNDAEILPVAFQCLKVEQR